MDLAFFLTTEGMLTPEEDAGTFKISLPLVHWMILQQIIPHVNVFPTLPQKEVPYHSSGMLDTLITQGFKTDSCCIQQRNYKVTQFLQDCSCDGE